MAVTPITQAYSIARKATGKNASKPAFTGERPSMLLYLGIGMVALLKDLLDLVFIGSLPGIGTVVTICFNILIGFLLFFDRSDGSKDNLAMVRIFLLTFITLVEGVGFGINFLPLQTLAVVIMYQLSSRAYRKALRQHEQSNYAQPYSFA